MPDFDPSRYAITVRRVSLEEGEFYEASVKELPDVIAYCESAGEAFEQAREAVCGLYEDAIEQGRPFPVPCAPVAEEFSGRVTLRVSKTLHALMSASAEAEGISLNSFIAETLAARVMKSPVTPAGSSLFGEAWKVFRQGATATSYPAFEFSGSRAARYKAELGHNTQWKMT